MKKEIDELGRGISDLAARATDSLMPDAQVRRAARGRVDHPMSYMRCAEFAAVLRQLKLRPGMRVLDVSSPQWFSLFLAERHPKCFFDYANIMARELRPFASVARACGLANLSYARQDVRTLGFADGTFDAAVSISVLEHVAPEDGGDLAALAEIARVLTPEGRLFLTVPYKSRYNVVRLEGPVYERGGDGGGEGDGSTFFAREYDRARFEQMVERSELRAIDRLYISERPGLLSLDFFEWGPGRRLPGAGLVARVKKRAERALGRSLDPVLARRYLRVTPRERFRLVNIAAVLGR